MMLAPLKLMLVPPLTLIAAATSQSLGSGSPPLQSAFANAIVPVFWVCALATARPVSIGGVDRTTFDRKVGCNCLIMTSTAPLTPLLLPLCGGLFTQTTVGREVVGSGAGYVPFAQLPVSARPSAAATALAWVLPPSLVPLNRPA